jgi:O-antigen/teichoic acid export membrane protein
LFGRSLLAIFGTYADQYAVLVVLTVGAITNAAFGKVGHILIMGKRGRLVLINTLINIGGNIVLNILLIPQYGAMGAAIATVFTVYFLTNLVALLQVHYYMDINTFDRVTMTIVSIVTICVGLAVAKIIAKEISIIILLIAAVVLLYRRATFVRKMTDTASSAIK